MEATYPQAAPKVEYNLQRLKIVLNRMKDQKEIRYTVSAEALPFSGRLQACDDSKFKARPDDEFKDYNSIGKFLANVKEFVGFMKDTKLYEKTTWLKFRSEILCQSTKKPSPGASGNSSGDRVEASTGDHAQKGIMALSCTWGSERCRECSDMCRLYACNTLLSQLLNAHEEWWRLYAKQSWNYEWAILY